MALMHVLVEWIGDEKPDCWKIIRRDDFLKPDKLKEGEVLDAYWKQDEETSPAKVLKISDNKQYLQSVRENEYFKPWKNSIPPKRVSLRKQLPDEYVSTDEGIAALETNKKLKKVIEKKSSKTEPPQKRIKASKSSGKNKSDDIADTMEDTEKEFSKSSKDEAEKVLAAALLKKTRQPLSKIPSIADKSNNEVTSEVLAAKKTHEPLSSADLSVDKEENEVLCNKSEDLESEEGISEKARFYGLVPPKKIKGCCEHCTELQERVRELEADVLKLSKKVRSVSRTSSGLAEKIEGLQTESEEANPEAELEKSCRQLTSNSTSLYLTEEDTVFSAGVDSKVVMFKLMQKGQNKKWIKTSVNRVHTHDVRALAMNEPKNVLVSGGVDTKLQFYSLSKFAESTPKMVPPFPQKSFISVAPDVNIIMDQCKTSLRFWRLGETDAESTVIKTPPSQLLQIKAKGDNHIMCSAMASSSSWVAFSDINHVSLFKVNLLPQDATKFQVSRVLPMPPDLLPAQKMVFTPDGLKLICASNQHSIQVLEIGEEVTLAATIHLPAKNEIDLPAMSLLAVSGDGQWLACVDSRNAVNVININKNKIHSTLPTFSSYITAMAFQPGTQCLALVCSDKQIFLYHTQTSKLTDWSKQAAAQGLPKDWVQRHQKIVGLTFVPSCPDLMILQDHEMFTVIDLREPLPEPDVVLCKKKGKLQQGKRSPFDVDSEERSWKEKKAGKLDTAEEKPKGKEQEEKKKPEEKTEITELKSFKICDKYKPLLFANVCGDGSLVVVERPWVEMIETLPATLQRKRYGRT